MLPFHCNFLVELKPSAVINEYNDDVYIYNADTGHK